MQKEVEANKKVLGVLAPFSKESLKEFADEMMATMEAREQAFRDAANHAFEAYIRYALDPHILELFKDQETGKIKLRNTTGETLDGAISNTLSHRSIGYFVELVLANQVSARQTAMAIKRHANDPKQKDKAIVLECWNSWQLRPEAYRGKAAFARDMLDKFPSLKSQPVIERWCREWEASNITQQAQ